MSYIKQTRDLYVNSSRNVKIIIAKTSFGGIARSIYWFVGSFIVYALGGENTLFGDVTGIASLFGLIAVLFAGWASDKGNKRSFLLYIGITLEALGLLLFSFSTTISLVLISVALINIAMGFVMIAQITIMADSTTSKEKNQIFSLYFVVENMAFGIGNLVAFFVFTNEESLNLDLLLLALKIGFVFLFIEFLLSFLVKDKYLLETGKKKEENNLETTSPSNKKKFGLKVPVIVSLSSFIISFGAGTSIIFLPRFFNVHYDLSLNTIAFLFAIMIFLTAIWSKIMGDLADKFGRIFSIVGTQLVATILLFILSMYPPLILGVLTLLIRNAFMNASSPVTNALLTDNIPVNQRARWASLSSLGWTLLFSLGNIFGGRIIDLFDFNVAFFITATLYLIGTVLLLFLKNNEV